MSTANHVNWKSIHDRALIVDLHAHPALKVLLFDRALASRFRASRAFNPFSVRTNLSKLKQGGLDVLLSTVYAPERRIVQDCCYLKLLRYLMPLKWKKLFLRPYFDVTLEALKKMEDQVAKKPKTGEPQAQMARSVRELDELLAQGPDGPIAVVHNVEGAHSLDGDLDNLQRLFELGVAYLTLAHFYENEAVHPCFPYPENVQILGCFRDTHNPALGLKPFGEQVIEKMIELGMILDITHCTPPARRRIYDIVGQRLPIIASHVGVYEINPSPYNLQDWEIKKIADTGGVVGVIFMNYWLMPHQAGRGLDFIARTIEHLVRVAGPDCVAIGSDFDGFTDPPDDLKDASELPRLTQRLVAEEYSEEQIIKILGGNALRVLRTGWGKKT